MMGAGGFAGKETTVVLPAAAAAAGWTIEEVAAGVGILGTAGGAVGTAAASGTTGWNFDGPDGNLLYPSEIGADMFLGEGAHLGGTLIRFFADGYIWNNECFVRYHGLFSNANDTPMCYTNHDHPNIVANRFIEVGFNKGGEELSSGLLTCGLSSYAHVAGSPEDPYVILYAAGHFDPVGSGDAEYGFTLYVSTFGTVHLSSVEVQTGGITVTQEGDQIDVKLNQ
jgi:hypothetical protein